MRRLLIAAAAVATIVSATSLAPNRAEAMTLPALGTLADSLSGLGLAEQVGYYCRTKCGYYGCRRRCYNTGPRYYRPYRYRYRYW